jgi:nucleotide-binding universal stress UspA family protein
VTGAIVCGVDFSDHSRRALAWAHFLAERLAQPLVVVHAVEPVLADAAKLTYGDTALQSTIEPELRAFVEPVAGPNVRLDIGIGEPASVLNGAALSHHASLLVVGTQGLGRAARVWFGSTTMRLLRETTLPVLAVPPRAADTPALLSLIVGTDFSVASEDAVETAIALGVACGVTVTCLHMVPIVAAHTRWNDVLKDAEDQAVRRARARLEAMTAALPSGTSIDADVRTGDAAEVLIQAADRQQAIIVVGLGGADTGRRPGTTAYRVVSGADAPVLGVPPRRA